MKDFYSKTPAEALETMFDGFSFSRKGVSAAKAAQAYLYAIEGVNRLAIIEAAHDFLTGVVTAHNRAFPPTAPEFADHARKVQKTGQTMAKLIAASPDKFQGLAAQDQELAAKVQRWMIVADPKSPRLALTN